MGADSGGGTDWGSLLGGLFGGGSGSSDGYDLNQYAGDLGTSPTFENAMAGGGSSGGAGAGFGGFGGDGGSGGLGGILGGILAGGRQGGNTSGTGTGSSQLIMGILSQLLQQHQPNFAGSFSHVSPNTAPGRTEPIKLGPEGAAGLSPAERLAIVMRGLR